jgi:hypothetical protein
MLRHLYFCKFKLKDLDEQSHGYRLQKQKQLTGPFEIHVNDDDTQIPPEIWLPED